MFQVHEVLSNQTDLHPRLDDVVTRHLEHAFRRPIGEPTRAACVDLAYPADRPRLLDGCCGLGESSWRLAKARPDAWVLGIDKSADRLERAEAERPTNLRLLRADLVDFALLARERGWSFEALNLFYPNPWPKSEHFQRRWHGHAVFPTLLELAPRIELRSNWEIYLREFARALSLAGWEARVEDWNPPEPETAFERKYQKAGQPLYRLVGERK